MIPKLFNRVFAIHRKARVGVFENLLLPRAAPAAPADPKAVRKKGKRGLTRRKSTVPQEHLPRGAFQIIGIRRMKRLREQTDDRLGTGPTNTHCRFPGTKNYAAKTVRRLRCRKAAGEGYI